jgi:3-deoxy-D-manno-octulosonate 8-phosphate phosphatase (KDO 8-P phosphatase)
MKDLSGDARAALCRARLLVLDVDGTLTDGRVVYAGDEEIQCFSVLDGLGLRWLQEEGIQIAWITGRGSKPTERRAAELGVRHLYLRVKDKTEVLESLQKELGLDPEQTLAMGDDVPDFELARRACFLAAPASAHPAVRAQADWVSQAVAGAGAVREFCALGLDARGSLAPRIERDAARARGVK